MQITLNGEKREFSNIVTISDLIATLSINIKQVAIEQNRRIISRSAHASTAIHEGDDIEIVEFIGGG